MRKSDVAEAAAQHEVANKNKQNGLFDEQNDTFVIGEPLFIRTITFHMTGKLERISHCGETTFLHLSDAAWIADDGRFTPCIEKGEINEVEPVTCEMRVNVSSIVDVYTWNHPLPRTQK
jgi:hypothetical protein